MTTRGAVIFDMDGVLSDSQEPVAIMESQQLARYGIVMSPEAITKRFAGVSDPAFDSTIFQEAGKTADVESLVAEKWDLFMTQMRGQVKEIPGAVDTARRLQQAGFALAIASSSIPEFIKLVVEELGIGDAFSALTSGTEVRRGKPDPDVFLLAAQRLGIEPARCVVIEDAVNGMQAAHRAGMKCVGLIQPHLTEMYENPPADIIVNHHEQITPELIRRLLS